MLPSSFSEAVSRPAVARAIMGESTRAAAKRRLMASSSCGAKTLVKQVATCTTIINRVAQVFHTLCQRHTPQSAFHLFRCWLCSPSSPGHTEGMIQTTHAASLTSWKVNLSSSGIASCGNMRNWMLYMWQYRLPSRMYCSLISNPSITCSCWGCHSVASVSTILQQGAHSDE